MKTAGRHQEGHDRNRLTTEAEREKSTRHPPSPWAAGAADKGSPQLTERELIVELLPSLRAFALSLTRNPAEADDVVQETLLRALASLQQFTPGTNLKAWLFRIQRNVFYSRYRKRHRETMALPTEVEDLPSIGPQQEWSLKLQALDHVLEQVTDEQKQALLLVSGLGLSYEEAAAVCDCALGTIKSRVSRARTHLLVLLEVDSHEDFLEVERNSLQ